MQLDQIIANIRLRNPWEAIDLGFSLIRQTWRAIYLPWLLFISCVSALVFVIFPREYQPYAIFAVWWLKPLYDRFLLNILSYQLFNEQLSSTQALQAIPRLIKTTGLLSALTFRRPSFSRGFNLPIWQLEQLQGQARSKRQKTLLQSAHSHAIALTLGMIFIEFTFYYSFFVMIAALIPQGMESSSFLELILNDDPREPISLWLDILYHVLYTTALFIIEPFYVAASFTLYLNRRTQLEAWDIELSFRQLAKRLASTGKKRSQSILSVGLFPLLFLVLAMGALSHPQTLHASDEKAQNSQPPESEYLAPTRRPAEQAKEVIEQVMQRHELSNEKTTYTWVKTQTTKKEEPEDGNGFFEHLAELFAPFVKIIATLFELSLWMGLAIGIALLYFTRKHWLYLFQSINKQAQKNPVPDILFGMDIRPQSLPDDIPQTARKLWQSGQQREALSLLYRGALAQMANQDQLPLKSSQTEGDILKLAQQALPTIRHHYLQQLTRYWIQIAYAHQQPDNREIMPLFDHWATQWNPSEIPGTTQKSQEDNRE